MEKRSNRKIALEKLLSFIQSGSLPSIPQVMFKIREVTDDPRSGVADLANVILTDHQLTTRILRMANSAFYGEYAGKVTRVTQAVSLMGFRSVRNASMALAIYSAVERLGKCPHFDFGVFWSTSIGTGVIAKQLAQNLGLKMSEEAFIGGFLHDIGQPLLATVFPNEYDEILTQATKPEIIFALEAERIGVNHMEAGGMLARAWGLPETLVKPIESHHSSKVTEGASMSVRLSEIVSFADRLYPVVMTPTEENSDDTASRLFGDHAEKFGVKAEFVAGLIEDGRALIVETAAELNVQIREAHESDYDMGSTDTLNSQLALRELQFSIMESATEALIHADSDDVVLDIILDGAFRGLELGNLVFFKVSEGFTSLTGVIGYGSIVGEEFRKLQIECRSKSSPFYDTIRYSKALRGRGLGELLVEKDSEKSPGPETDWREKLDHFAAIPMVIAEKCEYVAIATPSNKSEPLDEQRLRTLTSLCTQASLALERLSLKRMLAERIAAPDGKTARHSVS